MADALGEVQACAALLAAAQRNFYRRRDVLSMLRFISARKGACRFQARIEQNVRLASAR
jgi:hypothetical protein